MKFLLSALLLALACGACKDVETTTPQSDPFQLWRSYNFHNYSIAETRNCFCLNGGVQMRIVVMSDSVNSVSKVSDGTTLPYGEPRVYFSIDSLFGIIRSGGKDSIVVQYDEKYGYPTYLDINPQLHPVDGGVLYLTSDLVVNR
jgi:hypothetical protein